MSSREDSQLKRVLHAYHEAGHAVVWHVVGGLDGGASNIGPGADAQVGNALPDAAAHEVDQAQAVESAQEPKGVAPAETVRP